MKNHSRDRLNRVVKFLGGYGLGDECYILGTHWNDEDEGLKVLRGTVCGIKLAAYESVYGPECVNKNNDAVYVEYTVTYGYWYYKELEIEDMYRTREKAQKALDKLKGEQS